METVKDVKLRYFNQRVALNEKYKPNTIKNKCADIVRGVEGVRMPWLKSYDTSTKEGFEAHLMKWVNDPDIDLGTFIRSAFRLPPDIVNECRRLDREAANRNIGDDGIIEFPAMLVEPYVNEAIRMLRSRLYEDNIMGLMCVTGRRFSECTATSEFESARGFETGFPPLPGPIPVDTALFSGQLKRRDLNDPDNPFIYTIPILAPITDVVAARDKIRRAIPEFQCGIDDLMTLRKVNNVMPKRLYAPFRKINNLLKRQAGRDLIPTFKYTRDLYAAIMYWRYDVKSNKGLKYGQLLGHHESCAGTMSTRYEKYVIV